jgi:hypothetical protein
VVETQKLKLQNKRRRKRRYVRSTAGIKVRYLVAPIGIHNNHYHCSVGLLISRKADHRGVIFVV